MPITRQLSMHPYTRVPGFGESTTDRQPISLRNLGLPAATLLVSIMLAGCASSGLTYTDADAVPDHLDKCPGTQSGVKVDSTGCPVDTDVDGVADGADVCPSTPTGVRVDARGCPLAGERIAIVTNINFDSGRANVRGNVQGRLDRVVQLLKEMPDVDVQIVGYTDDIGSTGYNLELSLRRAESVRDYIVARGVDDSRLSVAGRGKSEPLVSNTTPEGRAVNRRVEFVVR